MLYGTVGDFVSARRIARAFGLFYTFVIAASALAPPIMGWLSDTLGLDASIRLIAWVALCTVPMALVLARQRVDLVNKS